MTAAFTQKRNAGRGITAEEQQCLGGKRAVLCRPKRQRVDSRAPRHIGERAAEVNHRVGDSCAIHMYAHTVVVRDPG